MFTNFQSMRKTLLLTVIYIFLQPTHLLGIATPLGTLNASPREKKKTLPLFDV